MLSIGKRKPSIPRRFQFLSRTTEMLGREEEKAQLWKFLDRDEKFLWWGIVGEGGVGKSRLALQRGAKDVLSWNKEDLVREVLDHERDLWQVDGVNEQTDIPLLIFSTLCGGIDTTDTNLPTEVKEMLHSAIGASGRSWEERSLCLTGHAMTGKQSRFYPMEPNLLGDLFLLEEMQPAVATVELDPRLKKHTKILEIAWGYKPSEVANFFFRSARDFPDHPAIWSLAEALLHGGIPWPSGAAVPEAIYNVYKGVVYRASVTVQGKSYHGFPECEQGDRQVPDTVLEELARRADASGDFPRFKKWTRRHLPKGWDRLHYQPHNR
ncbi:MAG: hypothetical protein HQL76_12520 [Magnetococcales bacterium]|nr:hypothetical protein [Magnetococcales bacterium]